jgi:hypothetical protein
MKLLRKAICEIGDNPLFYLLGNIVRIPWSNNPRYSWHVGILQTAYVVVNKKGGLSLLISEGS